MAWEATAEVGRFDEAVDWFQKRAVITKEQALELDLDARQRAFWVGGGLQLTQIQRVFDEIGKALESGEPFEDWRKRVRTLLRDDAHAETVFRNAAQRAYSAGRWRQMTDPDVIKWRPYFMHDSVLDSRTTETCRKLDGIVLPAEHEHWRTHWPPGHHRCRRGVRSLRKAEAERRGITNVPPAVDDAPGFGLAPGAQPVWKPDRKKHDPALRKELDEKEKRPPRAKKPKAPPPTHDPAYWEKQLEAKYGAAAPAVAWGRAMYERGLDRSAKEIVAELERLKALDIPGLRGAGFADLKKLGNRRLRGTVPGAHEELRGFIALAEHSLTVQRGTFPVFGGGVGTQATREAAKFYDAFLDRSVRRPGLDLKLEVQTGARAYYSPSLKKVVLGDGRDTGVAVHELAHAIEDVDARAIARSRAFLKERTKGRMLVSMDELQPGHGYRLDEFAREDEFFDPYIGRDYGEAATEVTSMGYQKLAEPFGIEALAKKDWEMFQFILGQLGGR